MKQGALSIEKDEAQWWIFHGQAQKIFKRTLRNEQDWADCIDSIAPNFPFWLILPEEDLQFERLLVKGLTQLPQADKEALAKTRLEELFPRALYAHFFVLENAFFFCAVLNRPFYTFLLKLLEEKTLLGMTSSALFFTQFLEKRNEATLFIQTNLDETFYEWVVKDNVLIFGRKLNKDFNSLDDEKEKLRRFLNLPVLNLHILGESDDDLKSLIVEKACPQTSFFTRKSTFHCFFVRYFPVFEKIMISLFLILSFFTLFFMNEIKKHNETILILKEKLNQNSNALGQAEFWANTQKAAPYFLENLKETDLFWQGKEGGHFEIFLPSTVENPDFARFKTEKTENGIFVFGNLRELP